MEEVKLQEDSNKNYNLGFLVRIVLTATLSSFLCGYQIGVFNTCQKNVSETLDWGSNEVYWISANTAAMPIGAIIGATFSGKLSNRFGRRKALLLNNLVLFASAASVSFT